MGQEIGRRELQRIFWGCLVVLIDVSIQGFDLLVDPIGYLMIAGAAAGLVYYDRAFRVVQICAYLLTVFSFAAVVRSVRAIDAAGQGAVDGDNVGGGWDWELPGAAGLGGAGAPQQAVELFVVFIGSAVGWSLLWSLLTGISRIARADGQQEFSQWVSKVRTGLIAVLIATDTFALGIVLANADPEAIGIVFVAVLLVVAVLGLMALRAIWDASKRLLFSPPIDQTDGNPAPNLVRTLSVIAAVAALAAVVVAASEKPYDPLSPVNLAADTQPPGRAEPLQLDVDVSSSNYNNGYEDSPDDFGDRYGGQECRTLVSGLVAIDVTSGDEIWSQDIPRQLGERLMTNADSILVLDYAVGQTLPNVASIDAASGGLEWQHFFEAETARFYGRSDNTVAISVGDFDKSYDRTVIALNGEGFEVRRFDDRMAEWRQDRQVESGYELESVPAYRMWNMSSPFDVPMEYRDEIIVSQPNGSGGQAIIDWQDSRTLRRVDTATGTADRVDSLSITSLYNRPGNSHSPGAMLQDNGRLTTVLLGSNEGPNSRLTVFEASSGTKLWEKEHLRSAAPAGNNVLFDKRNEAAQHELVTRTLFLVAGDDPDNIIWSTDLSVNSAGGNGYLGTIGPDSHLVFLVEGVDGAHDDFLVIPGSQAGAALVPDIIRAGGRVGGGPNGLSHVSDDLFVAAAGSEIVWQRDGQTTQRFDLAALEIRPNRVYSLTVVGETIVLEHDAPTVCGSYNASSDGRSLVVDPEQPTFNITSEDVYQECERPSAVLSAIKPTDGEVLWTLPIPAQAAGVQTFGEGTVLIADTRANQVSPSLTLVDVDTGHVRWQRFFEGSGLRLLALNDNAAIVEIDSDSHRDPDGTYGSVAAIVDSEGAIKHDFAIESGNWQPQPTPVFPGFRNLTTDSSGVSSASNGNNDAQAVITLDHDLVVFNPGQTDKVRIPRSAIYEDAWWRLGNDSSVGAPIQLGDDFVTVLLGSNIGPNSKLKVFDKETAELIWVKDHIRSAAEAGRYVLYDKRNDKDPDATFTRDLFLVDPRGADIDVWSANLHVNDDGGNGYIGSRDQDNDGIEESLIFLTASGDEPPDFLAVDLDNSSTLPAEVFAGGSVGGGRSTRSYLSDDITVAADGNNVIWQIAEEATGRIMLDDDQPIEALTATQGFIVVEQREKFESC